MAGRLMIGGAIFVGGLDVVPFLIAGTLFLVMGGGFVLFMALMRLLRVVK